MKRFVLKLMGLCGAIVVIVLAMHIVAIFRLQSEVDEAYTLGKDNADVLFVGSSQIGCSIEESAALRNRVLWVSATSVTSFYMRLLELKRREALKQVKTVVVPYNFSIAQQQTSHLELWAWYQELSVSYRYLGLFNASWLDAALFASRNLRYPFPIVAESEYPANRISLASRPREWLESFYKRLESSARQTMVGKGALHDWENRMFERYQAMRDLCAESDIRFVVLRVPVLPRYRSMMNDAVLENENSFCNRLTRSGFELCDVKKSYEEKLFFDEVHFVESGMKLYTQDVFEWLERTR